MSAEFHLRLYVAGDAPNSVQARANLRALCREHLPERHRVEVVDILREPNRALEDDVLLTPMLVKLAPDPVRQILGNLSETAIVLESLGLPRPKS